jgi:WD40 repeat protein/serine/threonine protein kinase
MNWERIKTIFSEAAGLASDEARARYLDEACAGEPALRREVEAMLAAQVEAGDFLERPLLGEGTPQADEGVGARIGPYRILGPIGEGGFGMVYLAEQETPVRRRVALKILKAGMDTKQVIARFEAERQALAMMDHPHIAKVFDAGTTDGGKSEIRVSRSEGEVKDEGRRAKGERRSSKFERRSSKGGLLPSDLDLRPSDFDLRPSDFDLRPSDFPLARGRPYFVMEWVPGTKITSFCDLARLGVAERLRLFIQVCLAIQHAHQKGIIHRDLKPSNVLVTLRDGSPVPKVIDFGIAKATTGEPLTDKTVFTAFEQFLGTPAYMSPEQAEMNGVDIDTRSDIYSLGVLLYELLTGTTPFDARELASQGIDAMRRTIREQEPVRPSTRLTQELARLGSGSAPASRVGSRSPGSAPAPGAAVGAPPTAPDPGPRPNAIGSQSSAGAGSRGREPGTPEAGVVPNRSGPGWPEAGVVPNRSGPGWPEAGVVPNRSGPGWPEAGVVPGVEAQGRSRLREQIKLVRGDLDWIVMKCLEKDRTRRYETASGLAADLQRYLENEPVFARPPSTVYRLQKALRRHKLAFATGLVVVTSLLVGLAVSLRSTVEARRERDNATSARRQAEHQVYVSSLREARLAWEDNNFARLRQILADTRNHAERGFEWWYWQRQAHLDLKTLRGHLAPVIAVGFSSDGRRAVTGSFDTTARVWDTEQGTQLRILRGHSREVRAACFAPDGQHVLTASADKTARLWETATGKESLRLVGHDGWLTSAAFSPDGRFIATGSYDRTARLWDAETGQWLRTLEHTGRVWSVTFSPDSRWLLTASGDESATVWEVGTGTPETVIRLPSTRIASRGEQAAGVFPFTALFSADARWILTGSRDQVARVWDRATGKELAPPLQGKPRWWPPTKADVPFWIAADPYGQWVVTGGLDRTAPVWSLAGRTNLFTLRGHDAEVAAVAVSPDGQRILTGSYDHTAKVWDVTRRREFITLEGHRASIVTVAYSRDGQHIATGSWDGTAKIWSTANGDLVRSLEPGTNKIWSVDFSPDGRSVITGGGDGIPRVWDVATGETNLTLPKPPRSVLARFSPDGRRILRDAGNQVLVWDTVTRQVELALTEDQNGARAVVSPDGQWMVTWSHSPVEGPDGHRILRTGLDGIVRAQFEGSAYVWDAATGMRRFPLVGHTDGISTAAFSSDSRRIITGGFDGTPRVWDALTGRDELKLVGHTDRAVFAAFTPDGRRIVTSSFDFTTRVWDASDGQELLTITGGFALALAPDGRSLVIAGPPPARVIGIASDEEVAGWGEAERLARERIEAERRERVAEAQGVQALGIKSWLVLGPLPFAGEDGATALDQDLVPPEVLKRPRADQRVPCGGQELVWRAVHSEDLRLDFARVFGEAEAEYCAAYAVCYLVAEADCRGVVLHVGSDDQAQVFLNGKELYRQTEGRSWEPHADRVDRLELPAGVNVLVFRVVNETEDWLGSVCVTDAHGQAVPGLQITLSPEAP